jgi:hypothetical protein
MFNRKDEMNLSEAIDRLSDAKAPRRGDLSSLKRESAQSWDLGADFNTARKFATEGWSEMSTKLWQMIHALSLKVELGVESRYDVAGESVDIGRYMSGEPESMLTQDISPLSSVSVFLNITARCNADADQLFNRGIAVAAIIHALQSSGRGVSLTIVSPNSEYNERRGSTNDTIIQLQNFGDYINPGRLAFWAAHPAALRRCVFRYNEQQPEDVREVMGYSHREGYGYSCDFDENQIPEGAVYIPFPETSILSANYDTPEDALKQVIKEFKKANVPIEIESSY